MSSLHNTVYISSDWFVLNKLNMIKIYIALLMVKNFVRRI